MASLPIQVSPLTVRSSRPSIVLFANQRPIQTVRLLQRRNQTVRVAATMKYEGTKRRERDLAEMIEKKVEEAKEVCEEEPASAECKVAWDEVEEVSQAKADLRRKLGESKDPLESFCAENPETDECRVYED
ncbi:hypothetical protein QJS10_CPA10g01081 [Acorus calamus]|uniref:CP12 domain-containing protein n=2 Tax=Acorus TaxID=4464 RepID=A0AAV9DYJ2_ACOCL|nr:hypothetical protein QJS10_CPA10g01081 [Acorus calamus]